MEVTDIKLQELISKCGGIPKVIVEIAGSMARRKVNLIDRAGSINEKFVQELETNREFDSLSGLFDWMQSYFRNCPDSLKPCIFYLSMFSPKKLIRRRRLVRRWIAEGYSRDSHDKTAEENGEEQFSSLLNLSIIQQPSSEGLGGTRMVSCGVNGFFREYIISRRMEENLVFELDGSCAPTTQRTGRHLVISEGWSRDKIVYMSIDFSKLRSLTVSGEWESFFISDSMKLLRVLDLEDALHVKYSDLKKIVKWFRRLKFLSLRGRSEICDLPGSVGDLRQLQSLDVRGTSIVTLPVSITKLEKLQYIRAGTTTPAAEARHLPVLSQLSHYCRGHHFVGIQIPPGIGKLTSLHTLGIVNVSSSGTKTFLDDLKKLTQLHKLGVSGINKGNMKKFWSAISVHSNLESLSVQFDKNTQGCLDGITLPPNILQSLKLYGLGTDDQLCNLPNPAVSKLAKMDLDMAKLTEEDVKTLGQLKGLCILRLCFHELGQDELMFRTNTNGYEVKSYEKLKVLKIACSHSSGLRITFGEKTMKELEHLKVDGSSGFSCRFSGIKNLPELKEVLLNGSLLEQSKLDHTGDQA
jgi:Leucine-rich repeat (LRR) protein